MIVRSRSEEREPVDWVDPLIDTVNRRFFFFSSACRPFGMVNLSPDTVNHRGGAWGEGYRYDSDHIRYFSHIHGWQKAGIPVLPVSGDMTGPRGSSFYGSRFSHEKEYVHPGYHRVYLEDYRINAELTSTCRVGFHRYTFDETGPAHLLIDLSASIGPTDMAEVKMERTGPREFIGYAVNAPTLRRPKDLPVHFIIQLDRDVGFGSWDRNGSICRETGFEGRDLGAFLSFDARAGDTVRMKVAISCTGAEGARRNMEEELDHWDFDRIVGDSRAEWNSWLGRIRVEGGTTKRTVKFYTDLYHALLGRRRVADVDGRFFDFTGPDPVIRRVAADADGSPSYEHCNFDALWGAQWTLGILWPLVYPRVTHDFVHSMLDMYRYGGLIPRGPSGGNYTFVMISPTSTPFIVAAWQKGVRTFDLWEAYDGMMKNHGPGGLMSKAGYEHGSSMGGGVEFYLGRGYVPCDIEAMAFNAGAGGTKTLEYAYMDWCLAQAAQALGKRKDYQELMDRSRSWRNVWDEETGFFRPRKKDGEWLEDFDPGSPDGWVEANAWQSLWFVPHDIPGLSEHLGGREKLADRLDRQFRDAEANDFIAPNGRHHETVIDYGNQPCTGMAHIFNIVDRPDLSQKWIRKVVDACKSDITPDGGYGGDEDQGQMGALNVLMTLGLFQETGGCEADPEYELTTPFFPEVTIDLDGDFHAGRSLRMECDCDPEENPFIASAEFNGKEVPHLRIPHSLLSSGGVLRYSLEPSSGGTSL